MTLCEFCTKETNNPKFCSRTCAAVFNNKKFPKRRVMGFCKNCNIPISRRNKYCLTCKNARNVNFELVTIGDLRGKRKYQKSSRIRNLARALYIKSQLPRICLICGYSLHIEICHKIAIKNFSLDTPLSIVNSIDNLLPLCPNHHWELDSGNLIL